MPIPTQLIPYEFLARWDEETGAFKGAHAIFFEVKSLDGEVLSKQMGPALTPEQAAQAGFPFEDVLAQLQTDALTRVSALEAQVVDLEREKVAEAEAHAAEVAAKDANMQEALAALEALNAKALEAEAKAADLEAKLAEAQSPLVTIAAAIKGLFTKAA